MSKEKCQTASEWETVISCLMICKVLMDTHDINVWRNNFTRHISVIVELRMRKRQIRVEWKIIIRYCNLREFHMQVNLQFSIW